MSARASSRLLFVGVVLCSLLALLCTSSASGAKKIPSKRTELRRIRTGVTQERTRVVLDLSGAGFTFAREPLGDSALVLRFPGVALASGCPLPLEKAGLLRRVRCLEEKGKRGTTLAVRLSFAAPARAAVFRVPASQGQPERLVADLVAVSDRAGHREGADRAAAGKGTGAAETGKDTSTRANPVPDRAVENGAQTRSVSGRQSVTDPPGNGRHQIVIDAGHGGNDPGAVAKDLREKDVCLDVARRLAGLLESNPGVTVSLSRTGDVFLPLRERLKFAEKKDAELFVSIHVNAAPDRKARGMEVYFLSIGAASDAASRELARLENEADPDYVVESDEDLAQLPFMVSLRQSDTLLRSSRAAEVVLDVLTQRKLAEARGVKQAGFAVLKSFQVPSVLVELGFISSARDRKDLADPEHRQKLAQGLADGIGTYFEKFAPRRVATP